MEVEEVMEGSEDSWVLQVCQIVVMADKRELVNGRRLQMPVEVLENADLRVVVLGGGAAGHTAC